MDIFGEGGIPKINNDVDANRMGCLNMIVGKLIRYASNWDKGGHKDSLDDISVYAQMLNEIDGN